MGISDITLILRDGGERRVEEIGGGLWGTIDSGRSLSWTYRLQKNPVLDDIAPEDLKSCVVRTECGIGQEVEVARRTEGPKARWGPRSFRRR